jgi:hypothetical protein
MIFCQAWTNPFKNNSKGDSTFSTKFKEIKLLCKNFLWTLEKNGGNTTSITVLGAHYFPLSLKFLTFSSLLNIAPPT